jgi:SAM-dependent methyltransferase
VTEERHEAQPLACYLACPRCHHHLEQTEAMIACSGCGATYRSWGKVPILFAATSAADDLERVQALYDDVAGEYDQVFAPHVLQHYLDKRLALIQATLPGGLVLDVGCGTAALAAHVARAGYEVSGIDASAGMLAQAADRGLAGVYAADATALPFADASFDLAYTVATLHHLETPARVAGTIAEMARVVRSGGYVLLWDHNPLNPYWPIIMRRVPQDSGDERLVPLREMLAGVRAAGMRPVAIRRLGLIPDFVPARLMPFARAAERTVESLPLLRLLAAHNVVLAQKPRA